MQISANFSLFFIKIYRSGAKIDRSDQKLKVE
jgi:hypothetical protein